MGINKSGKPRKHNAFTQARILRAVELLRAGKTLDEIGSSVDVSKEAARQWVDSAIKQGIFSWQEYEELKNRGIEKRRKMYFADMIGLIDYLDKNSWLELKDAYRLTTNQARDAERHGIESLANDCPLAKKTLDTFVRYGISLSRLEGLAESQDWLPSNGLPADVKMIRHVLYNFKMHKASMRVLRAMSSDYIKTNLNLGEIAKKYFDSVCRQNPAADSRQQLQYAVELGMIKKSDFERKGRESQKAAWAENGRRQGNYSRAH
jgi:hypothetical protein